MSLTEEGHRSRTVAALRWLPDEER